MSDTKEMIQKSSRGRVITFRLDAAQARMVEHLAEESKCNSVNEFCKEASVSGISSLVQMKKDIKNMQEVLDEERVAKEFMMLYLQEITETILIRLNIKPDMSDEDKSRILQRAKGLSQKTKLRAFNRLVKSFTGEGDEDILMLNSLKNTLEEQKEKMEE